MRCTPVPYSRTPFTVHIAGRAEPCTFRLHSSVFHSFSFLSSLQLVVFAVVDESFYLRAVIFVLGELVFVIFVFEREERFSQFDERLDEFYFLASFFIFFIRDFACEIYFWGYVNSFSYFRNAILFSSLHQRSLSFACILEQCFVFQLGRLQL